MIKIKPNQRSLDTALEDLNTRMTAAIKTVKNAIEEIESDGVKTKNEKYIRKTQLTILLIEIKKFHRIIKNTQYELYGE